MTAPKPLAILWGACERCRGGGEPSPVDSRFCALCLPAPQVLADRTRQVDRRHRQARHAADRTDWPSAIDAAIAPDAEHIWLMLPNCSCAHLFADAETEARCGRIAVRRRVRADLDTAAPETARACGSCRRSYRRGRRGP